MCDENVKKVKMTDEERLELSTKLDKDLDSFMEGLEKKAYTDGWAEDKWQEEMEKHPFFMTKFPENPSEVSPLLQGIQQLKYDTTANTPLELAQSYKEDGNFNFKHKKYRMAVISYTEGIRANCEDSVFVASLYNNRSAAQFFLNNFRSSLLDCTMCLKLNPKHEKAELRAIQCCLQLRQPKEALAFCESFLEKHGQHKEVIRFKNEATKLLGITDRDSRKKDLQEKRQQVQIKSLQAAIQSRGVEIEVAGDPEEVLLGMHERPQLLTDGSLTWPVFFLYPEYSTSDFVQEFSENNTMQVMLEEVLNESPDWDEKGEYKPEAVSVYYEGGDRSHLYLVNVNKTIANILKGTEFVARDWRPAFLVFVKESPAEINFLKNYTVFR